MITVLKWLGGALLALIFLYMAGRLVSAGVLRSWKEMKQKEGTTDAEE